MTDVPKDLFKEFEEALSPGSRTTYLLRLYVSGTTPKSVQAIANINKICKEHLRGRYSLEVIDIYQKPQLAKRDQIVAMPTLIKELPAPLRRIIGDLSNTPKVLVGLDIVKK